MEYLIKFIDIIAWPSTTLLLAWFFRAELRTVLSRISTLKYKDLEAKFEKGLSQVQKNIEPLNEGIDINDLQATQNRLERLIEISPRAAILEGWIELEQALFQLGESYQMKGRSPLHMIKFLNEKGVISKEFSQALHEMRRLRNEAAHVPDFVVEEKEAQNFINLSSAIGLLLVNMDTVEAVRS